MAVTTDYCAETTKLVSFSDVFSELLRSMQIAGSLLLNEDYAAPWAISIPNSVELVKSLESNNTIHIAAFHLVRRGYVEIELDNGNTHIVNKGEMAICFSGMAHTLYQGTSQPAYSFREIMQGKNIFKPTTDTYPQSTSLICGIFMLRDTLLNPLFEALPPLLKITTDQGDEYSQTTTAHIVNLLLREIDQQSLAHSYSMERYLELLCARSIHSYIESLPTGQSGWLQAIKDPMAARVITAIHSQPALGWSVKEMAKLVSLSPSRFAARFTEIMGTTPMVYVTRWRMYLASKLLNETQSGIEQISTQVGYDNVAAFSRAFKRNIGSSPGIWRTCHRGL
ncbi:MAG: AraC family transcriptional regulator [Methylococcales bacterium]